MQPVRNITLGVLSLQWNAEGNLKTHVLRRKRGPTCVFWSMNGIKASEHAHFFADISYFYTFTFLR